MGSAASTASISATHPVSDAVLWIVAGAGCAGLFALFRLMQTPFETRELWLILCAFFFINDGAQVHREDVERCLVISAPPFPCAPRSSR